MNYKYYLISELIFEFYYLIIIVIINNLTDNNINISFITQLIFKFILI